MIFEKALAAHTPLLIEPAALSAHLRLAERAQHAARSSGHSIEPLTLPKGAVVYGSSKSASVLEYFFGARQKPRIEGSTGIIPICGPIGIGLTEYEKDIGCTDVNDLAAWLAQMQADASVQNILLDVNSPGGVCVGVPEFASMVASSKKRVYSFTATQACSAAYWIASQADELIATPSAYVGSIGVYIAIPDFSVQYSNAGVKVEVIKSGDLKGAGIEGTALTDAQRAQLQSRVTALHAEFKAAVTSMRITVGDDSMRGQSFTGSEGAQRGLVTGLVNSRAELMQRLTT